MGVMQMEESNAATSASSERASPELNAPFAASQYLWRDQKFILVDRRECVGGTWVDTYDYVRLHLPNGLFTVGNIGWTLGQDPSYSATQRRSARAHRPLPMVVETKRLTMQTA